MSYTRYAIYFVPPEGMLADFGASWLGWDVVQGKAATQFDIAGLHDVTMTPRKYGFHGTLKPPFRLAEGTSVAGLEQATATLAKTLAPGQSAGLELATLGRFLALVPTGDMADLRRVAEACVQGLDDFRAPLNEAELARRRKARLSPRQDALLEQWGYPYVMEEFRFHLTLTGRLDTGDIPHWQDAVRAHLPPLPQPFVIDQIALCGERSDGCFEVLHRYALTG